MYVESAYSIFDKSGVLIMKQLRLNYSDNYELQTQLYLLLNILALDAGGCGECDASGSGRKRERRVKVGGGLGVAVGVERGFQQCVGLAVCVCVLATWLRFCAFGNYVDMCLDTAYYTYPYAYVCVRMYMYKCMQVKYNTSPPRPQHTQEPSLLFKWDLLLPLLPPLLQSLPA